MFKKLNTLPKVARVLIISFLIPIMCTLLSIGIFLLPMVSFAVVQMFFIGLGIFTIKNLKTLANNYSNLFR
jgi:hypothetical protein